ncbi:sensor domain-containing diguanylate cyclase [Aliivibrio sp. S3MY1]|uniref:sensor domain-containing diguanylate cyclase n=1 Tax=unclassified Aliivibrio TaxID=2645654 RepID=UPI002379FF8C|nr:MULTISPECIES: sensor domain-containing diguanylate cyclase [unclassified Aliivibrio]MDD9195029.1 sensor domain-containing diguanylate cyclase [Aliivibrio sp. S3MY1]MDD9198319.1 sensor domain-containing diguanylate cyclase [Aliivibrio sp. S2MY1]
MITTDMGDFHWAMQVIGDLDAGLIVLDKNFQVCAWNGFMQSYSGITSDKILGRVIFDIIPELPEKWLRRKINASFTLNSRGFSCWEDRPYLFKFKNFTPFSNSLPEMRQNITFSPLTSLNGQVSHISLVINDVTGIAQNKIHLQESNHQLSDLSKTDGLTKLFNRAYWESCLKREFEQAKISGTTSSVVIFDIDHFKKVNDTYGHTVGDDVIRNAADFLRKTSRNTDICGRYGGEEFTVILPSTNADQALYFAERLRKRIEMETIEYDSIASPITYKISLGICELSEENDDYLIWLERADKALYYSKQHGRNQSTIYSSELS